MTYYTVWQFDGGTEDFRCKGIFMDDRAAAHCADHNATTDKATGDRKHAPIIVHDDFAHLVEYLTRARIGQLADVLVRLEQQLHMPGQAEHVEDDADAKSPPHVILRFGNGDLVVDTGTFATCPAVFITAASQPGEVGTSTAREVHALDQLQPGETVLQFHTVEQAEAVANMLVGPFIPPAAPVSFDEVAGVLGALVDASTAEVNEKGGAGGDLLARLTDARNWLSANAPAKPKPEDDGA